MAYGSLQTGFNAFAHHPKDYATAISTPTLLLHGAKDPRVSTSAIQEIYENLKGKKQLIFLPDAGHENYLIKHETKWVDVLTDFLLKK